MHVSPGDQVLVRVAVQGDQLVAGAQVGHARRGPARRCSAATTSPRPGRPAPMNRPALPTAHRPPLPAVIRSGSPAPSPAQRPKAQLPGFGRRSLSPARKALGFPFSIARDPSGSSFGFALKEPDLPLVPGGQGSWPGSPGSAWTSPPALAEPRVPDHACSGIQIGGSVRGYQDAGRLLSSRVWPIK